MAPEIIKRTDYDGPPVDIWSLGVVLYAILVGRFPFAARNYPELYKKILTGYFTIPEFVSPAAQDLINRMMLMDPAKRFDVIQVKVRHI